GVRHYGVAVRERSAGLERFGVEVADHPGSDEVHPTVAVDETVRGGGVVLIPGRKSFFVELPEEGDHSLRFRCPQADLPRVVEEIHALLHEECVEIARI